MSSVNDLSFDSVMFLVLTGHFSHIFIKHNRSPLLQVLLRLIFQNEIRTCLLSYSER